jgi:hypothetical protein
MVRRVLVGTALFGVVALLALWFVMRTPRTAEVLVTIVLPSSTMKADSMMQGEVRVSNKSGAPIQTTACGSPFAVALRSDTIEPEIIWTTCLNTFTIPVGESSYPIGFPATYSGCSPDQRPCNADGSIPALPPGDYEATLYQSHDIVPAPAPVPVRVT